MEVHPVLLFLSSSIPVHFNDENTASYELVVNSEKHEVSLEISEHKEAIEISYRLSMRCPSKTPRTDLYFKALGNFLSEGIHLSKEGKLKIVGHLVFHVQGLNANPYDVAISIKKRLDRTTGFFSAMAATVRICYRLQNRAGTDRYRKLLPSKLAALTTCGFLQDGYYH